MNIERLKLGEIVPYKKNNRKHSELQIERIARSIQEFGFNQPICIDENNEILVGHGRLLAAQKLGLKDAPIVRLNDLTEEQKRAYRILDNKLQNDSEWDFDSLSEELDFLQSNGVDLESWGLDDLCLNKGIEPISADEQSDLSSKDPITCPECGHEFIPKS